MASSTDLHLRLLIDANGNAAIQEIGRVRTGVAGVGTAATTATTATTGMMQSIVGLGAGVFAIDRIASAIGSMVEASAEAARAATKLETGLANAGGATASQVEGLKELAQTLQDVTGYDGDATIAAQARLATYGLTADEIARLTPGLLDMAEAARKSGAAEADLEGIAKALGKARTDGVEALRRYGVAVTDVQAAEFEAASDMERTALLVDLLSERFGGLAAAVGADFDGAIRRASAAQGDLAEAMGDLVTKGEGGSAFMDTYTSALKSATAAISDNADGLRTLLGDAGYTAVGAALIYVAAQGAKWVAGQRAQVLAAGETAEAARIEAIQLTATARAKELNAAAALTAARSSEAQAAATLGHVRALGVEQPYLLRTASYHEQLAAAKAAEAKTSAAAAAAQTSYNKALAGTATAASAASAAAAKQGLTWKALASGTTALNAAMAVMVGYEVGSWLRGLAADTKVGQMAIAGLDTAFSSLSETYRLAIEAEQRKAATDEVIADRLRAISEATGLVIKDTDELNRMVESGEVVWNAQTSTWERGTAVVRGLAEGLGDVDTAYVRVADVLERTAKLEEAQATARQAHIKAAADAAKASGDEATALELLSQARAADVAAAERQVEFQRALLAETESRIAQQARENAATASGTAARQALLAQLQEEETQRRTALTLAEATVAQARVEADQAAVATRAYGDQSASLAELIAGRTALTEAQRTGRAVEAEAAAAAAALAEAQAQASVAVMAYNNALTLGGDTTALQAGAVAAQERVAALESAIAKGAATASAASLVNAELVRTKRLVGDAATDLASRIDLERNANERALSLDQARIAIQQELVAKDLAVAQAKGDSRAATEAQAEATRLEIAYIEAGIDAKIREATLLIELADAKRIAAQATGELTAEVAAETEALLDAAEAALLESKRQQIAADTKREVAAATDSVRSKQQALKNDYKTAGDAGVDAANRVTDALGGTSDATKNLSDDLSTLSDGTYSYALSADTLADAFADAGDGDASRRRDQLVEYINSWTDGALDELNNLPGAGAAEFTANLVKQVEALWAEADAATQDAIETSTATTTAATTTPAAATPATTTEVVTRSTVDIKLTVVSGASSQTATLADLDAATCADFIACLQSAQAAAT